MQAKTLKFSLIVIFAFLLIGGAGLFCYNRSHANSNMTGYLSVTIPDAWSNKYYVYGVKVYKENTKTEYVSSAKIDNTWRMGNNTISQATSIPNNTKQFFKFTTTFQIRTKDTNLSVATYTVPVFCEISNSGLNCSCKDDDVVFDSTLKNVKYSIGNKANNNVVINLYQ